jgi:myosin heavy subunit
MNEVRFKFGTNLHLCNFQDMSNLSFLNDASVLHNLRSRYGTMLIYVSI